MPDLTLDKLKQAYDGALEQIAAESHLQKGMTAIQIVDALKRGNNPPLSNADDRTLAGALRMTQSQADAFGGIDGRYQLIDAYENDAAGFSAVALLDTTTNSVIISVRSTEFRPESQGGDRAHDVGTDIQIQQTGFSFDQILSLEAFKDLVRTELPSGVPPKFNLVGYSLSGNDVRTIDAMFPNEFNPSGNIVFNATGLGNFVDPTGQNRPRNVVLQEMVTLYRTVEEDPTSVANDTSTFAANVNLPALYDAAHVAAPLDLGNPSDNVRPE